MRLDKYLKVARILKRRTLSKELLDLGLVKINGRVAKPSTDVKANDILEISMKGKLTTIKVLEIKEYAKIEDTYSMYQVLSEEKLENFGE